MNVADRMRVRPATIAPEASLAEAQRVMTCARTAALVVSRYDRVVGVITEVDLALARPSPATTLAIREIRWWLSRIRVDQIMQRDPPVVGPATPYVDALWLLRDSATGLLPVVDGGHLVGVVTAFDALHMGTRPAGGASGRVPPAGAR
jgi:CBS domain-containing protein